MQLLLASHQVPPTTEFPQVTDLRLLIVRPPIHPSIHPSIHPYISIYSTIDQNTYPRTILSRTIMNAPAGNLMLNALCDVANYDFVDKYKTDAPHTPMRPYIDT
jgi:hypothetical protein